jgi:gluconate 5-dehydrogenase
LSRCTPRAGTRLQTRRDDPGTVDDPAFNSWILGRTQAACWGTVQDLVGPAVFFASPASDYVNGQVLFIDGGKTAVV